MKKDIQELKERMGIIEEPGIVENNDFEESMEFQISEMQSEGE